MQCLRLKTLLEIEQETVFVDYPSKGFNLTLVIIENQIEAGNRRVALEALPLCNLLIMSASWVLLMFQVLAGETSFQPLVNVRLP